MAHALSAPIFLAAVPEIPDPNPLIILPFAALLLCIALLPIFLRHHWEKHYPKISVALGLVPLFYYLIWLGASSAMLHAAIDYLSFMVVVGSLFVTSGSIHLRVKGAASPWGNCLFLLGGTLLGNVIGAAGASILLIGPWIRMNKYRFTGYHLPFFIFTVSNLGGALTPMGPPLYMGYLQGVPFWWAVENCWKPWGVMLVGILAVFYFIDRRNYLQASIDISKAETTHQEWRIDGAHHLLFLAVILLAIVVLPPGVRELVMLGAALISFLTTPRPVHEANDFTFGPLKEVAWLFAGIFATMKPALDYMVLHGGGLGLRTDSQFFWLSGILSGVLDNAPTYLTFLAAAFGQENLALDNPANMQQFIAHHGHYLAAISFASASFGALTYLGNGPNLLVKAIADHAKVKAPGFIEYLLRYSAPILIPLFILVDYFFFERR